MLEVDPANSKGNHRVWMPHSLGLKKMNEEDKHNHKKFLVDLIDELASKLSKKEKSKILDKPIKPRYLKR